MKRRRSELEIIKNFIDGSYNRLGNSLLVDTETEYDPMSEMRGEDKTPLGYCFKHVDPSTGRVIYQIRCSRTNIEETDFRVMMHEYGHIYLGHLDGIHEDLDSQIMSVMMEHRGEIIDRINQNCGIDFAEKLIERVIDDPVLNHSLHNIAMDMEVNTRVLSDDDIEEMELDLSSLYPRYAEEALKYLRDSGNLSEEEKKEIDDAVSKMEKEAKIKLILPKRYSLGTDDQGNPIPFPSGRSYAENLLLIVQHLDQFVKMLVSINMGKNGDTSEITKEMVQQALRDHMNQEFENKSEEYRQGYRDAMNDFANGTPGKSANERNQQQGNQGGAPQQQSSAGSSSPADSGEEQHQHSRSGNEPDNSSSSGADEYNRGYQDGLKDAANGSASGSGSGMDSLSNLMGDCGIGNGAAGQPGQDGKDGGQGDQSGKGGKGSGPRSGMRKDPTKGPGVMDHRTDSRDEADRKRALGQIKQAGGVGCGSGGGPDATREVDKNVDEVEMALNDVMLNMRSKVIKQEIRRDVMRLYNRGIIRSVIAPSVSKKISVVANPKIVYLIDVSGSMDTNLVDRVLKSIAKNMKKLNRGLKYDIITWSTRLGEHIRDIDPGKPVPRISMGGGTSMADGIRYFKDNYGPEAILIVISDFEDYLEEWNKIESTMPEYDMWGFNYGNDSYKDSSKIPWKNMKIRRFKDR